jgi:hypothetical protein
MLAGTEYVGVKDISTAGCTRIGSTDSSVSILTRLQAGRPSICVSTPGREHSYSSFSI